MGSFHWSWWLPLSKALRSWPFSDRPSLFTGAGLSEASPHYLTYFFSIVNMFSIAFSRVEIVLRLIFFCKMLAHVYFCCSWCNLHLDKKFDCWQQSGGEWLIVGQCCKTLPNAKRIKTFSSLGGAVNSARRRQCWRDLRMLRNSVTWQFSVRAVDHSRIYIHSTVWEGREM